MLTIGTNWGDSQIRLEDWLENGPGFRWLVGPEAAMCADKNQALPLRVVPLQYRNVALSRFLIAMGVYAYPWQRMRPENHEILRQIDATRAESINTGTLSIQQGVQLGEHTVHIADAWQASIVELFGHGAVLLTKLDATALQPSINQLSFPLDAEDDVVILLQVSAGSISDGLAGLARTLLPEAGMFSNFKDHRIDGLPFETVGYAYTLAQHHTSVGVHLIELASTGDHLTRWAQVFFIARNVNLGMAACTDIIEHFQLNSQPST